MRWTLRTESSQGAKGNPASYRNLIDGMGDLGPSKTSYFALRVRSWHLFPAPLLAYVMLCLICSCMPMQVRRKHAHLVKGYLAHITQEAVCLLAESRQLKVSVWPMLRSQPHPP